MPGRKQHCAGRRSLVAAVVLLAAITAAGGNSLQLRRLPLIRKPIPYPPIRPAPDTGEPRIDSVVPASGYPGERLELRIYVSPTPTSGRRPAAETAHTSFMQARKAASLEVLVGTTIRAPLASASEAGYLHADVEIPAGESPGAREVAIERDGKPLPPRGTFTVLERTRLDLALSSAYARVRGETLFTGVQVQSIGGQAAPGARLRVSCRTAGDPVFLRVPALEFGQRWDASQNLILPRGAGQRKPFDTVSFVVEARGDADLGNNRAMVEFRVTPPAYPDLAVTDISHRFPSATRLQLQLVVANTGDAPSGPTRLDIDCSPEAWPRQSIPVPAIPPGGDTKVTAGFDIPPGLLGKTVTFAALADYLENERNLENNGGSHTLTLPLSQSLPNLSLLNAGYAMNDSATRVTFWVTAQNRGDSVSGNTRLVLAAGGSELGDVAVPALRPSESKACTLTVAVPQSRRGQTVEFIAHVDPDDSVQELDETDNILSLPVPIPPPIAPKRSNALPVALICAAAAIAVVGAWVALRLGKNVRTRRRSRPRFEAHAPPPEEAPPSEDVMKAKPLERAGEAGAGMAGAIRQKKDDVYFTVTSPAEVAPKADFLVNVWAHLDTQREEVLKRAHQAEPKAELQAPGKGPFAIARDTELDVLLSIEDCSVEPAQETIRWTGAIANAGFAVTVNEGASEGSKRSYACIRHGGLEIARVRFLLKVTTAPGAAAVTDATVRPHRRAFASYARDDSHDVLTCIQGMEKALPGISIFIDVLKFRSGEYWEARLQQEILASDVFYLFWSKAAAESEWVSREWRFGLERKGLDFIDPVPLVSPRAAPPPPELSAKHFDDWELAFKSYQEGIARRAPTATGAAEP
jgi:hypothetical protein